MKKKTEKFDWMLEVKPQLYSSKPNKYIVYSEVFGLYDKKQGNTICEFLNQGGLYRKLGSILEE